QLKTEVTKGIRGKEPPFAGAVDSRYSRTMVEFCLVDEVIRMGTRRRFLLMGGIGLIAAHPLSRGQPAAVIHRVGVLVTTSEATNAPLRAAFSQARRDLGGVEG